MTLGDDKSAEKKVETTPPRRASDSKVLGQLPRASEFSPAEVVPRLTGSPTEGEVLRDGSHSLQWRVSSVRDKETDKSMSKTVEGEPCVFCGEGSRREPRKSFASRARTACIRGVGRRGRTEPRPSSVRQPGSPGKAR
eukprot:845281-Rhodomonas_salina.1